MSKLKVVLFNGPPRSGKDSATDFMIQTTTGSSKRQFKDCLIALTAAFFNKSVETFLKGYNETLGEYSRHTGKKLLPHEDPNQWYKDYKGTITQRVGGKQYSKREALIHVSEKVIKPIFGESAFGDALVKTLPKEGIVFIPDSGFIKELEPVINHMGHNNVLVIKIKREGCNFTSDSRNYLDLEVLGEKTPSSFVIENNGTEEDFHNKVEKKVKLWLSQFGESKYV